MQDTLWGKPANDILNGRDSVASAPPVRALWEMVQNARDVSADKCNIIFTRKQDVFEFRHDGLPFENSTLNALILQTSTKVRGDGDQVGQYGTGFLTTHKFGRVFHLSGSLRLVSDDEVYYCFPQLIVDRSPNTKEGMVESLASQFAETNKWRTDLTHRKDVPERWTVFSYQQPNPIERESVKEAFEKAPEIIPYILNLNEGINSIQFVDELADFSIRFSRGETVTIDESELNYVKETAITIDDSRNEASDLIVIRTLDSKKITLTKSGKEKPFVSVILPLNGDRVIQPSYEVARMFIYLPLIGTERWGINFIIHSPIFTCASDDRSSLRLIMDGQTENDPAAQNQSIIAEATKIIFEYIGQSLKEWHDIRYLAPIYFDMANANKALSNYYRELKTTWLSNMNSLPLVDVATVEGGRKVCPKEIFVLDSELSVAVATDHMLLQPLHNILTRMHPKAVPIIEHLLHWSNVLAQWHEGERCQQIVGIEDVVNYIHNNGPESVSESDLLAICHYLRNSGQHNYFDKNILLTEVGTLTNKTEGYKPDAFVVPLKEAIKVLLPEQNCRFVKPEFADIVPLTSFSCKDVKDMLPSRTEELQKRIKSVLDGTTDTENGLLDQDERNSLLDYCRMVIPRSGEGFSAKALKLICEHYDHSFDFDDSIDSNLFDWRGALRTLISNVLTEVSLLDDDMKLQQREWIRKIVECVHDFSDFSGMLQNFKVYLSQNSEFRFCKELKKGPGIPERMKDIYNAVASKDGNNVDCRADLFDPEFEHCAITDAKLEIVIMGKMIMDHIYASRKYPHEIETYEHKDLIIDIINNFESPADGNLWRSAFETINNDVPFLLSKLVLNKGNRESMIKIMKVKDKHRLNKAAEILYDENMLEIWEMGKTAWIEKQNEEADFQNKKKLGEFVEEYLLEELKHELIGSELTVDVDDKQNGQDIIVSVNGTPAYYIEVKSRWSSDKSVMMSSAQLDKSAEEQERYSLFAVDMVGYNRDDVKKHAYPDSIKEFVERIKVIPDIGNQTKEIKPSNRDMDMQVHIGGDYKAVVPQKFLENNHIDYFTFLSEVLKPCVKAAIGKS